MIEGTIQIPVVRRRVIQRPRLIRLLDEANARLVLLVAPAGYGKTTLARQWLERGRHRHAWYTATPPSADVSALALGLARVLEPVVAGPAERMRQRLLAVPASEREPELVAEILADSASAWPDEAWLVVDDYHHVAASATADRFFERFVDASGIRLLLTGRTHPSWESARSTAYGRLAVVGAAELALTPTESAAVLGVRKDDSLDALLEATHGWPVVTGLAAVTRGSAVPELPTAEALYDFLADEVFTAASPETRRLLCSLAFVSVPTLDVARLLTNAEAVEELTDEAERLGLLERERTELRLHPLLREFLRTRFAEYPPAERADILAVLTEHLLAARAWDDLFELVEQDPTPARLDGLVGAALRELVTEGRLGTLAGWCEFAERQRIETPSVQLALAEASLLRGEAEATLVLARGAAVALGNEHPLASRAWAVAGWSAYFLDYFEEALEPFARAKAIAQVDDDRLEALWGEFNARRMQSAFDVRAAFAELEPISGAGIDGALRYATARCTLAERVGGIEETVDQQAALVALLDRARNPAVTTGFLYMLSQLLVGRCRYDEAVTHFTTGSEIARSLGYRLVLPPMLVGAGHAELGCRRFGRATRLLAEAEAEARSCSDVHNLIECEMVRTRLLLALGAPREALQFSLGGFERPPSPIQEEEWSAVKALAAACAGELDRCDELLARAEELRWGAQTIVLGACTRLIAELVRGADTAPCVGELIEAVTATGWLDPLVSASRGWPGIVPLLSADPSFAPTLRAALKRSRDYDFLGSAHELGPSSREPEGPRLSKREDEVFALLCQGLSNREIANALFISDVTVKVHLRHVYRKLGVRTRLEAVARAGNAVRESPR